MTQEEQITKILELENAIRDKQVSKLSAHTLVPVGLVLGIVSSVFFFGVTFQRLNNLESAYLELKVDFKGELLNLKNDIKALSTQLQDVRVLIINNNSEK